MKIWVIGRGYPTQANKMWGLFELEQAKLLARNEHEVSYIALTLSFFSRKDYRGIRSFREEDVNIHTFSHFYFPGKLGIHMEKFENECWRRLLDRAEKSSGKPDIIHIHYPSMIGSIKEIEKYRKKGVKIFVTEHWSRVMINNLKGFELARLRYYASNANSFASVSEVLMNATKRLVDMRVPTEIVPNIVSPIFYEVEKENVSSNEFTFICIGRLVKLKQFDMVIKAFEQVFAHQDNVKLRIIGSGSERRSLEQLAKYNSQVSFIGELELKDVAQELVNADALISFSKYETFAVPVTEAWACGKPVIVSERSGVASYVNKGNGIVVSAADYNSLGAAIKNIYVNYETYNSDTIKAYSKENFSDIAVMNKLAVIYRNY